MSGFPTKPFAVFLFLGLYLATSASLPHGSYLSLVMFIKFIIIEVSHQILEPERSFYAFPSEYISHISACVHVITKVMRFSCNAFLFGFF